MKRSFLLASYLILIHFSLISFGFATSAHPPQSATVQEIQRLNNRTPNASPEEEAKWLSNQYQTISHSLKEDKKNNRLQGQSIFNMSIFTHIKTILTTIIEETNRLVELIMPGKPETPESDREVAKIVNSLDAQRKSLTNYISVKPAAPNTKFDPAKYDRPQEKRFNVFGK